jgi:hypothetical protein
MQMKTLTSYFQEWVLAFASYDQLRARMVRASFLWDNVRQKRTTK